MTLQEWLDREGLRADELGVHRHSWNQSHSGTLDIDLALVFLPRQPKPITPAQIYWSPATYRYVTQEDYTLPDTTPDPSCECGAEKTGGLHSDWCPKRT